MTSLLTKASEIKTTARTSSTNSSGASALVEALQELYVDSIFGYPGASIVSIYNELSNVRNIRQYLVRHEQAAVHAAEGYARISGKPGVVLVTSGPGFTNTITGIANAYADSTPLVVLAGDVASNDNKGKVFQKVDILSLTKTCSKKNYLVTSKDDIKQVIKEAYEVANILESKYAPKIKKDLYRKKFQPVKEHDYERTLKLIANTKSPLLLLGGGAIDAVESISKFIKKTKIPVVSTLMGIGTFPSKNELYMGMIGINGSHSANMALNNADLIISLGVSFSDRSTCKKEVFAKNAKIINVNIKKSTKTFELNLVSDTETFIVNLMARLTQIPDYSIWHRQLATIKEEHVPENKPSKYLHSSSVIETIYEQTRKYNPVVVTDVGQHQMLTAQFFNFDKPKKFITSGGLGTMGFGLPASIGAYIANPSSLVLNITGDGSFQMDLQELATCREHNIPIKIIIMNNSYLGMVRQLQERLYNNLYQVKMTNPDFTKIAEAYDLYALRVKTLDELVPAIEKILSHKGTAILDIAIDSFEEI